MRGCFVTATDTGVGKTVVAAAIAATLRARGERVAAFKPVVTGLDEPEAGRPADHELLAAAAGVGAAAVSPFTFGPAVSPHLAASLAGASLDARELLRAACAACEGADVAVVEGVGGLLVPLAPGYLVRDFAVELGLPLVVAARPGLGTINHTLLTLEAARSAGLGVRGVVLTPWPPAPGVVEESNAETIAELGDVPVRTLGFVAGTEAEDLAAAGETLPLDAWTSERP